MILIEAINKLLRDSINSILNIPNFAIAAKQKDAPRPIGAYAAVDIINETGIGWEQSVAVQNQSDPDLNVTVQGMRSVLMTVDFFRESAGDNARLVRTALVRESIQSLFRTAKIGLATRSEVRELSDELESGWEERFQFDITLSLIGDDAEIVTSICSADLSGEFQSEGTTNSFNIEVQ